MTRRALAALTSAVLAGTLLAGSSAVTPGSWNLAPRLSRSAGWVTAAGAGKLMLYLRNEHGTVQATDDPASGPAGSLATLAAGQALITWEAPDPGGGTDLAGIARSDVVAVTILLADGTADTVQVDALDGFGYVAHAPIVAVEAIDASGTIVGTTVVPATGSTCAASVCRGLAGMPPATGKPLWGIFSTAPPRHPAARPALLLSTPRLSRVNPKTLQPFGRSLELPTGFEPSAIAPQGTELLGVELGATASSARPEVVNLGPLTLDQALSGRLAADIGTATIRSLSWPTPNRILALVQRFRFRDDVSSRTLLGIDARTGKVVWRRSLPHRTTLGEARTVSGKLVLLFATTEGRLRQTVIVASANGEIHATRLVNRAGIAHQLPGSIVVTTGSKPTCYIVGTEVVYSLDLATAHATEHRLRLPVPTQGAPTITTTGGGAVALGSKLVIDGTSISPRGDQPLGVYLVNPRTWKATLLTHRSAGFVTAGRTLVLFGRFSFAPRAKSAARAAATGIALYDTDGTLKRRLYPGRAVVGVTVSPELAYAVLSPAGVIRPVLSARTGGAYFAFIRGTRFVFDPATGKNLGKAVGAQSPGTRLIYPGESFGGLGA